MLEVAQLLLDHGADATAQTKDGSTPSAIYGCAMLYGKPRFNRVFTVSFISLRLVIFFDNPRAFVSYMVFLPHPAWGFRSDKNTRLRIHVTGPQTVLDLHLCFAEAEMIIYAYRPVWTFM